MQLELGSGGAQGSGFRIQGSGVSGVSDLGFRGSGDQGLRLVLGLRVTTLSSKEQSMSSATFPSVSLPHLSRVSSSGFRVQGLGFRV